MGCWDEPHVPASVLQQVWMPTCSHGMMLSKALLGSVGKHAAAGHESWQEVWVCGHTKSEVSKVHVDVGLVRCKDVELSPAFCAHRSLLLLVICFDIFRPVYHMTVTLSYYQTLMKNWIGLCNNVFAPVASSWRRCSRALAPDFCKTFRPVAALSGSAGREFTTSNAMIPRLLAAELSCSSALRALTSKMPY